MLDPICGYLSNHFHWHERITITLFPVQLGVVTVLHTQQLFHGFPDYRVIWLHFEGRHQPKLSHKWYNKSICQSGTRTSVRFISALNTLTSTLHLLLYSCWVIGSLINSFYHQLNSINMSSILYWFDFGSNYRLLHILPEVLVFLNFVEITIVGGFWDSRYLLS
jgi:hypothetical protein